jgi:argininosuccinate lyase
MSSILKGGRLTATRPDVVNFISSLNADRRIALSTVMVNEAHVVGLERCKAIQRPAARRILRALRRLEKRELGDGHAEDVHVVIEEFVTRRTGQEIGGLLHIGKSRNDQVAAAIRMTIRSEILELAQLLLAFELSLIGLAKKYVASVFPGYTHLQPAQPISFAHYLLANCFSFIRDSERLVEAYARINLSPMGAAALAGTSFPLDRVLVARLLGFDGIVDVSLDAVGGRDFALEALGVFALIATDLSRMSSDILFYSSAEVGLIELPDEFASTSSIMPQKKNPDPLELIRAKSGKVAANFSSAVTLLHGLTSGYNLDYQELTPMLWQSLDELKSSVSIFLAIMPGIKLDEAIASRSYLELTAATEVANILVREEHLPFRAAHQKVGYAIRTAIRQGKALREMQRSDWQRALRYPVKQRTLRLIAHTLDLNHHIRAYRTSGSPNPQETRRLVARASRRCRELERTNRRASIKLQASMRLLRRMTRTA